MFDKVIVIDFGSQYNQLIVRRLREMHVYSELLSYKTDIAKIKEIKGLKGIILSGSPKSVYAQDGYHISNEIFELNVPVLGICYGMQIMADQLGGKVEPAAKGEFGNTEVNIIKESKLFKGIEKSIVVWMSHNDKVTKMPEGFECIADTPHCEFASMQNVKRNLYAIQFHAEVNHTPKGFEVIKNFAYEICGCTGNFTMESFVDTQVSKIREEVKDKKVLLGLSGGVDSSVAALLINKAIGSQLTCMFINNGLLRKNEENEVIATFKNNFDMNFVYVDASEEFLSKLAGVTEPEKKRKIIGHLFVEIFERESKKLGQFDYLAQGTLYTDVIESGTATSKTIKSHHNVGGLPEKLGFKLIEPLNTLFKDEVRQVGKVLNLNPDILYRQPFPGPGLSIRVLGEVTKEKLDIVRDTDFILREEIKNAGLQNDIWQYFTVLPGIRSVGVMGDDRTYLYTIGIRAVTSKDGMTADFAHIPYEVLGKISNRIVNECKMVNRVVYDVTSKPPATIEWE